MDCTFAQPCTPHLLSFTIICDGFEYQSRLESSAMAVQWLILRPATPHLPLIPSNGFMPEIQGKKRAPTGLPSRFQVSLDGMSLGMSCKTMENHQISFLSWVVIIVVMSSSKRKRRMRLNEMEGKGK